MTAAPKPVDFFASAKRHFDDAELLRTNSRMPNSGQLYGFCAECGIKALFMWHRHAEDTTGSPPYKSALRNHINALPAKFNEINLTLSGRTAAKYTSMLTKISHFGDWNVDHRYYNESSIPKSTDKWKSAAEEVMAMLQTAKLDGIST